MKGLYLVKFSFWVSWKNNLLSPSQSGFQLSDSFEGQLSFVHSIYVDFDQSSSLEVRANVSEISKVFKKVWHIGLLYKLKTVGISGESKKIFQIFFSNRLQKIVLNRQFSNFLPVLAGVPQGSILEPMLFLIYSNDLPENLGSFAKLFCSHISLQFSMLYFLQR